MLRSHAAEINGLAVMPAAPEQAERLYRALTLAFANDPPVRWMLPEPKQYLRYFPVFARAFGGAAIRQRTAFASRNFAGAALWLAPGLGPDEEALLASIMESVAPERQAATIAVFEEMARYHPGEPHWYLPLIGVEPAWQGRGLGAALLQPILAECDAARLPAYLESTNPRNQVLYERHGFEPVGEILLGGCPPIVPMVRRPSV